MLQSFAANERTYMYVVKWMIESIRYAHVEQYTRTYLRNIVEPQRPKINSTH